MTVTGEIFFVKTGGNSTTVNSMEVSASPTTAVYSPKIANNNKAKNIFFSRILKNIFWNISILYLQDVL